MQEDHTSLRPVIVGGSFECIDEVIEALVDAVNSVAAAVVLVTEELEPNDLLLVLREFLGSVREDHVVDPLEGVAGDSRIVADQFEIVLEGAFPMQFLVIAWVVELRQCTENVRGLGLFAHSVPLKNERPENQPLPCGFGLDPGLKFSSCQLLCDSL